MLSDAPAKSTRRCISLLDATSSSPGWDRNVLEAEADS